MKKLNSYKLIITIILVILIGILLLYVLNFIKISRNDIQVDEKLIYSTRYYFGFGSRGVKIYESGVVYDDLEIESPNHKPNYKYKKILTEEEIIELKDMINKLSNDKSIKEYVIKIVYGVEEFDDFGN